MIFWIARSLVVLMAALVGAGILSGTFRRLGQPPAWMGALFGAVAGGLGSLIFLLPLGFCTFEPERTLLDIVFGLGLAAIGAAIAIWPLDWFARRRFGSTTEEATPQQKGVFKGWLAPWLLLAPTLTILVLFLYYPSLDTLRLSTLLTFVGAPRSRFVCVDNFTALVNDADYLRSLGVTFFISFAIVAIGLTLSLGVALLAYQPLKGANLYRTFLIWPYAISPAVAGLIFFILFNPIVGLINHVLDGLFGIRLPWLQDPNIAPWTVITASVWKQMGYNIIFYIAGLQNLPADLQEAAAIDGANAWKRFLKITVPLLSPITFFLVITNLTYAFFDIFGTIDLLTAGGPLEATTVLIYRIYEIGVSSGNLGRAAAQSVVLFLLVVGLTLLQFRTTEKSVTYGG